MTKEHPGNTPATEPGDADVVRSFLEGDERAFTELVRRYQGRIQALVHRMVRDRACAEDLTQETFLRVFRHLHHYDQTRKFSSWILTIAGNLARNELRRRSRTPLMLFQTMTQDWPDDRPLEWEDKTTRPDDLYRKRHLRTSVEKAVDRLPNHQRAVFILREMHGKQYQEIAHMTGSKVGTVKSRLSRARARFANNIAPMIDGP